MSKPADLNRCLTALDQEHTIIAVIEMSQSSWLVAGVVPGIARHPLKKLTPDQDILLKLLHRWREEAGQAGQAAVTAFKIYGPAVRRKRAASGWERRFASIYPASVWSLTAR